MKKFLTLLFTILSLTLGSLAIANYNFLNTNSWSISIGAKNILASWKNDKMGDSANIFRKKLKLSDTLFVERYLCGFNTEGAIATLTIKNSKNEIITEAINKNNQMMFKAKLPLSEIFNSAKYKNNETLAVYFSIDSKTENINETVLLGKLNLK